MVRSIISIFKASILICKTIYITYIVGLVSDDAKINIEKKSQKKIMEDEISEENHRNWKKVMRKNNKKKKKNDEN